MNWNDAIASLKLLIQSQEINLDSQSETLQDCIEEAIDTYSHDRSGAEIVSDLTGNGSYMIAMPANFTSNFSVLKSVEYPVNDAAPEPTIVPTDEYVIYQKPDGSQNLRMMKTKPPIGADVRILYTAYFSSISDVLTSDEKALLQLSAYYACLRESQKAANTTSDGEGLDFVDMVTASNRYETLGDKFLANYNSHMFGDKKEAENLTATVTASANDNWSTQTRFKDKRIFHEDDL